MILGAMRPRKVLPLWLIAEHLLQGHALAADSLLLLSLRGSMGNSGGGRRQRQGALHRCRDLWPHSHTLLNLCMRTCISCKARSGTSY